MKKFKKLSALLLAVIMTLAMAVPAMAGDATSSTLTVTDLVTQDKDGNPVTASVNLYQIAEVSENGEIDWVKDETGYKFANAYGPTSQEINTIANNVVKDTTTFPAVAMTVSGSTATYKYTNNDGKGAIYIAVPVANDGKTVYNPIVLATTNVAKALTDASISVGSTYGWGETGKAKKTDSTSYKEIISGIVEDDTAPVDANDENGDDSTYVNGESTMKTADANSVIGYKATINPVPVYPENASNKSLWIKDTLQDSLYYVNKDAVAIRLYGASGKIGDDIVVGSDTFKNKTDVTDANKADLLASIEYTGTVGNGDESFTVVFDYDKIVAAGATRVDVIYAAKLDPTKAKIGHIPNTNTMEYYYSLKPTNGGGYKPGDTPTPNDDYAHEVDKEDVYTYKVGLVKTDEAGKQLSGALFDLYDNAECTGTPLATGLSSDDNGIVSYNGIVKAGTYYFKETKAPNGYTINEDDNPVAVTAKWTSVTKTTSSKEYCTDPTEVLTDKGGSTTQVGWIKDRVFYEGLDNKPEGKDTPNTTNDPGDQVVFPAYLKCVISTSVTSYNPDNGTPIGYNFGTIKNSSLTALPSTGGIGTYIFTIAGVAILAIAAFMLIFKRRKVEE